MQAWENIRVRARAHGESIKSIARQTGHSKNTIRKYLRTDTAPKLLIEPRVSVLTPFIDEICALLRDTPKLTAARIVSVLQERHGQSITIGERAARKFIARYRKKLVPREAFVRLVYQPASQMQIDFKQISLDVHGESLKHWLFSARLSYSGAFFGKVFRSEDTVSLLDGILSACEHFGGTTAECLFDNAKTAVTKVLPGRKRNVTDSYATLVGALGMKTVFAAPAKGNEKGGVESVHGYIEDNFFRPQRSGNDLAQVNRDLGLHCADHAKRKTERFAEERGLLRSMPEHLPSVARIIPACINKFAEITFATNRYSVPSRYAHREGEVHVYSDRVEISIDQEIVATHARCFERKTAVLDPLHFLDVLSKKHRAVERAEVFTQADFPQALKDLLATYLHDDNDRAGRNFMRVMDLHRVHPLERLVAAVITARERGTVDAGAIALILEQGGGEYDRARPQKLENIPGKYGNIVVDLAAYTVFDIGGMLQ